MKQVNIDELLKATEYFAKRAEEISIDSSLVDSLRQKLGPRITQDAGQFLNTRAVSSIPVRIEYNKPKVEFVVSSTGSDAVAVDKELKNLLDKKYGPMASGMLAKSKEPAFGFNLLTVE